MPPKDRHVFVYNKTKETFLAFRVNVADSILSRLVGLLGKRSLKPDSGVWIVPANSVHTIGMLFAFDLVLIDKDFKVVGLREMVRPFRVTRPIFRAESVLELPAHRKAVRAGHDDVQQDHVRMRPGGDAERLVRVRRGEDLVPPRLQHTSQQPDVGRRIVDDQDLFAGHAVRTEADATETCARICWMTSMS